MCRRFRRRGWTLVEVLVVLSIIAALVALLLPAVQWARESSRRVGCQSNLKQIGLALQSYHDAMRRFPSGYLSATNGRGDHTGPGWSWTAQLLPYLEQEPLANRIDSRFHVEAPQHADVRVSRVRLCLCPSDAAPATFTAFRDSAKTSPICDLATASYVGVYGAAVPGLTE